MISLTHVPLIQCCTHFLNAEKQTIHEKSIEVLKEISKFIYTSPFIYASNKKILFKTASQRSRLWSWSLLYSCFHFSFIWQKILCVKCPHMLSCCSCQQYCVSKRSRVSITNIGGVFVTGLNQRRSPTLSDLRRTRQEQISI